MRRLISLNINQCPETQVTKKITNAAVKLRCFKIKQKVI